jgi:hypothetical protein
MKALYDARVGDLGSDDYLRIDCLACKRHSVMSEETLRLQRALQVQGLQDQRPGHHLKQLGAIRCEPAWC